jgi:hypothetical protein
MRWPRQGAAGEAVVGAAAEAAAAGVAAVAEAEAEAVVAAVDAAGRKGRRRRAAGEGAAAPADLKTGTDDLTMASAEVRRVWVCLWQFVALIVK